MFLHNCLSFSDSTQPTPKPPIKEESKQLSITQSPLPITDYRLPITDYRLPITDYRLPITDYRLPIPHYHRTLYKRNNSPSLRLRILAPESLIKVSQSCKDSKNTSEPR